MSQLGRAVAAPVPVTIEGKDYLLAPLTVADYGQLYQYARLAPYRRLSDSLKQAAAENIELPEDAKREWYRQAYLTGQYMSPAIVENEFASVEGAVYQLWLSLKKNHPEIKRDDIHKWPAFDFQLAVQMLNDISGMDETFRPLGSPATVTSGSPETSGADGATPSSPDTSKTDGPPSKSDG